MSDFEIFEDYLNEIKDNKIDKLKIISSQIKKDIQYFEQERTYNDEIGNIEKFNKLYYELDEKYKELERINFFIKNYVLIKWIFSRYETLF